MRTLLLAALVATAGLARAAEPPPAQPDRDARPAAEGKPPAEAKGKKAPKKAGAKAQAAKPPPPGKDGAGTAAKPEAEKPCEPVKPCPID